MCSILGADTFRRVFAALDPQQFGRCFVSLVAELSGHVDGKLVCIDGKTMRRTFARERGQGPLHMVSAWLADNAVTLGQLAVDAKSNEITAIPELLALLEIRGATVTIDAAGCQRKIAAAIVDKGADYVLALKGNQPLLEQEVASYFEDALGSGVALSHHQSVDKGHGRIETRRTWTSTDLGWMSERRRWKGLVEPGHGAHAPPGLPRSLSSAAVGPLAHGASLPTVSLDAPALRAAAERLVHGGRRG